jgi:uncharacterized protein Veg
VIQEKDAFYFTHDANAKDDPKCVLLIEQLGPEGYGIFWILVETLRDQPGYRYPLKLIPALARRYNTTAEKMGTVVKGYELFTITEDMFFYSESLLRRMESWEKRREQARIAGIASARKRLETKVGSTDVQQTTNGGSTKKGKEKKGKDINTYPSEFEIFWSLYPRTKYMSKRDAYKKWNARIEEGYTPEIIIEGVKGYAVAMSGKEERFIKQPETFLGPGLHFENYVNYVEEKPEKPIIQPDPSRLRYQELMKEYENECGPQ